MKKVLCITFWLFFVFSFISCKSVSEKEFLRCVCFDDSWAFHYGDIEDAPAPGLNDNQWQKLDLPHDWSIELPFSKEKSAGRIAVGHTQGGTGWYRKKFVIPHKDVDKIQTLYFEGVYMDSEIWINGRKVASHPYGYTSFKCNITDYCNPAGQENTIAVKTVNEGENSRWYAGAGIYRHVWMITTDRLHLDEWGTFITTDSVSEKKAKVDLAIDIFNQSEKTQQATVHISINDTFGNIVGKQDINVELKSTGQQTLEQTVNILNPNLWSVDTPYLYIADIKIKVDGKLKDAISIPFGVRNISFSAEKGFLLNGKSMKLKGGCIHHDNGFLGAVAIDRAEERKVELLKANGFNAVRCAHNPPSEKFLEACDRLGLLVIDEAFDQWQKEKNPQDYHRFFDECHERDLASMILRDRNHPSIIMWSIGNEIKERSDSSGITIARKLRKMVHRYDTTRPVTAAINDYWDNPDLKWKDSERAFATLEAGGYNYMWWEYENDHKLFPQRVMYGSESTAMERAINWDLVEKHPYIIGDFIWTAIDYLGESGIGYTVNVKHGDKEPPQFLDYPWFNAWCGDIDICGDRKPQSLLRDVLWNNSKIEMLVHTPIPDGFKEKISYWGWYDEFPSWNWKKQVNKTMDVKVYTRYPQVRLYLNDKLIEEKTVPIDSKNRYTALFKINYTTGILKAVGVDAESEKESVILKTTGNPAAIKLTADRSEILPSRNDLSYIKIELIDKDGNVVPDSDRKVQLTVEGEGVIAGSGNASPVDMESFRSSTPETYKGKALAILRPTGRNGNITLRVDAKNLPKSTINITVKNKK